MSVIFYSIKFVFFKQIYQFAIGLRELIDRKLDNSNTDGKGRETENIQKRQYFFSSIFRFSPERFGVNVLKDNKQLGLNNM